MPFIKRLLWVINLPKTLYGRLAGLHFMRLRGDRTFQGPYSPEVVESSNHHFPPALQKFLSIVLLLQRSLKYWNTVDLKPCLKRNHHFQLKGDSLVHSLPSLRFPGEETATNYSNLQLSTGSIPDRTKMVNSWLFIAGRVAGLQNKNGPSRSSAECRPHICSRGWSGVQGPALACAAKSAVCPACGSVRDPGLRLAALLQWVHFRPRVLIPAHPGILLLLPRLRVQGRGESISSK